MTSDRLSPRDRIDVLADLEEFRRGRMTTAEAAEDRWRDSLSCMAQRWPEWEDELIGWYAQHPHWPIQRGDDLDYHSHFDDFGNPL